MEQKQGFLTQKMYYWRKRNTSDNQEINFETLSHDSLGYVIQLL